MRSWKRRSATKTLIALTLLLQHGAHLLTRESGSLLMQPWTPQGVKRQRLRRCFSKVASSPTSTNYTCICVWDLFSNVYLILFYIIQSHLGWLGYLPMDFSHVTSAAAIAVCNFSKDSWWGHFQYPMDQRHRKTINRTLTYDTKNQSSMVKSIEL